MKQKLILLLFVSFLLVISISCEDEPSAIGTELITGDLLTVKTFDTLVDSVNQSSSYFKNVIPLGSSSWILIGKYQDIDASVLLKFIFGLTDSLKEDILDGEINVTDSWIILTNRYVYGDTLTDMEFTAHKVNSYWSSTQFTIDSLSKLDYENTDVSSGEEITDSTYTFHLDGSVVLSWMKNAADNSLESNYGIYLKPADNSGKVVGFEALTPISTEAAELFVVYEKTGVYTDTISGFVTSDISLVDGNLPTLPSGVIAVQSGLTVNSKIKFDLSALPEGSVINYAELILTQDTLNSIKGNTYDNSLQAFYLVYSDSLNTLGNSAPLYFSSNKFTGNVTGFVRSWVDTGENSGLLIQSGNPVNGLELFAIFGSDDANEANRPRLRITYTTKDNL